MNHEKEDRNLTAEPELVSREELEKIVGGDDTSLPAPSADILARAVAELGKAYSWGGVGPDSYDTSGFVSYCVTGLHARLGTTFDFMSWPQAATPEPGDICTNSSYCGIYAGPNSMIYVSESYGSVRYGNIAGDMVIVRYVG